MSHYAIIRHARIKTGRNLVAARLHNVRGARTPNADAEAPAPIILVGSRKPWRDVMAVHDDLELGRLKIDANACIEVFTGASPEWWTERGWTRGETPTGRTLMALMQWRDAQLDYLHRRFDKRLIASVVLHLDEATPHMHALVVPAQFRADGRERGDRAGRLAWRLSTEKALPGRAGMKAIVTDYAAAMAPLGLVRGEDRDPGTVRHRPLREWQAEQADLTEQMETAVNEQTRTTAAAREEADRIRRDADDYARRVREQADRERAEVKEAAIVAEELAKRKDDAASAARTEARAELARAVEMAKAVEAERVQVRGLRDRLESMLAKVEKMLIPIRAFADKYLAASPLIRQAMGAKGPDAVRIASSTEVAELEVMRRMTNGRGGR